MYSTEEVLQILRNVGVDTWCGACCEVAFTGATLADHVCDKDCRSASRACAGATTIEGPPGIFKCRNSQCGLYVERSHLSDPVYGFEAACPLRVDGPDGI
jgi:hypothetical protein